MLVVKNHLAKLVVVSAISILPLLAVAGLEGDSSMPSGGGGDYKPSSMMPIDQTKGSDRDLELKKRARYRLVSNDATTQSVKNIKVVTLNDEVALRGPERLSMSMEK